jgi:formamidase
MPGTTHEVRIDRSKRLAEQPETGHNRWHPSIPPIVRMDPGDEVILETRDALDGQFTWDTTLEEVMAADLNLAHALTGPVWVNGAEEGDLLEVEILDVVPADFGFTSQIPGFGFLRDVFTAPHLVRWRMDGRFAESPDLPGVRIPEASFSGVIGLAPSLELLERITERESVTAARGGLALPPDPRGAVPASEPIASNGLRTIPPRETAGNLDIKQLTRGTTVYFPVWTAGAQLSIGDAHFAQGDGECCGTAIEMEATFHLRINLQKGAARARRITGTQFARLGDDPGPPALPRRYYATTGLSMSEDGVQESEDATLAARNALLAMIDHLEGRGFTRQQAYAICSVAVDLKVSEVVDVPNFVVSAFLPLDIFV